jgi:hypothetical protein
MLTKIEELLDQLKAYADTRIALAKLEAAKKISHLLSSAIAFILVALLFFLFMLMISIAGAWALGNWFHSMPLGFLVVGIVYLIVCLFIWTSREKFLRVPIMNSMIMQLFPDSASKEEKKKD